MWQSDYKSLLCSLQWGQLTSLAIIIFRATFKPKNDARKKLTNCCKIWPNLGLFFVCFTTIQTTNNNNIISWKIQAADFSLHWDSKPWTAEWKAKTIPLSYLWRFGLVTFVFSVLVCRYQKWLKHIGMTTSPSIRTKNDIHFKSLLAWLK